MFISVAETANKFNISKRRVQSLCKKNRIEGSKMINGVWCIPQNSIKPADARLKTHIDYKSNENSIFNNYSENEYLSIKDVCKILSISEATAKNWIKLGKLEPINKKYFNKTDIELLYKNIQNGTTNKLKTRRNKKNITGNLSYKDYIFNENNKQIINNLISSFPSFSNDEIKYILAYFSIQLYNQTNNINNFNIDIFNTSKFTNSKTFNFLIKDLINNIDFKTLNLTKLNLISKLTLQFEKNEDTLGYLYISMRNLNSIKSSGAYYTPNKLVDLLLNDMLSNIDIKSKSFCDPCCGTGNFLISLCNKNISPNQIYGQDIDDISIFITRINIFLLNQNLTIDELYSHFIIGNTLNSSFDKKFSIIFGNPPWGYNYSNEDINYLLTNYKTAKKKGTESFELFIEKGINLLEPNGYLYYILPESLLNVACHNNARELILKNTSFKHVNFLGNAFSNIQCPSIIIGIQKNNPGKTKNCNVIFNNKQFTINIERNFTSNCFSFNLTDDEFYCLNKIESIKNAKYLLNNAKFALGIVTGDNKKFIHSTKTDKNDEVILKGSNIYKYSIKPDNNYIKYEPKNFQQVASTEIYRNDEKLLYRFISETPVFTYDNNKLLSLNSCNIVIPEIQNMSIKYILAILNSSISTFYINKKFNSIKLLRNHIESLPIPETNLANQNKIIKKVDAILNSKQDKLNQYNDLDNDIFELYNFNEKEKSLIKNALKNKANFII